MAQVPVQKFEEILRLIWSHLIAANVHLTIWEELRSTPDRQKLCNIYTGFFYWTLDAHADRFIHKICVVTDCRDPKQPSIYKLANMIQAHPSLAPGINYNNVLQRLARHAQARDEIRTLRNTRAGHWDLNKRPPEPSVAKGRELLAELHALLEEVWNAHQPNQYGGLNHYSLTPTGHSHTAYVLDKLTETMLPKK